MREPLLIALLALSHHDTMTDAAAANYMAVSTLSRRIMALEEEVGLVLVERCGCGAKLTVMGQAFIPIAEEVLAALGKARQQTAALRRTRSTLSLGRR